MRFFVEHKWIFALLIVAVLGLSITVISAVTPGQAVGSARVLGGMLQPFQLWSTSLSDWFSSLWGDNSTIDELLADNQRLRQHAAEVEQDARLYAQTLEENEQLRTLLGLAERRRDFTFAAATVISRDLDNYARTLMLSRGSDDDVIPGMVAVTAEGQMIGVISEVGSNWATLRTVVDVDFSCGAYAYDAEIDATCEGRFDLMRANQLALSDLSPQVNLKNGDLVLTSGVGGLYPRDLEIGTVQEVQTDITGMTATAILSPSADLAHLEKVFIILSFDIQE